MSTESEEAAASKAAESDSSAMSKLIEGLDQVQPPDAAPSSAEPPSKPSEPPSKSADAAQTPPEPDKKPSDAAPTPPVSPEGLKAKDTPAEKLIEPDEFEKEVDAHELPAGATQKAHDVLAILRQKAKEEHKAAKELKAASEAWQKEKTATEDKLKEFENVKSEADQYRDIVQKIAIEQDPNFNANFNSRLTGISQHVLNSLAEWGLPKETAEYIAQHGGPLVFSQDTTTQCTGPEGKQVSHREFWDNSILNQLTDQQKKILDIASQDALRVSMARDAALKNAIQNREQYFKDQEIQLQQDQEKFKAAAKTELDKQLANLGDLAKEQKIPVNVTPEEKVKIEAHNNMIKQATEKFEELFFDRSPAALVQKTLGALYVEASKNLVAQAQAERDQYKKSLDDLQKKWDASLQAANTSQRKSVQQTPKPQTTEIDEEKDPGRRMERMLEALP